MEKSSPLPEHRWLERLVGSWDVLCEYPAHGDTPGGSTKGIEVVRSLGGLWFVAEGTGPMPGCEDDHQTILTLGYEPGLKKYVGTWIGSMMAKMWHYHTVTVDTEKNTISMESMGPSFTGEGEANYRDLMVVHSDDLRTMTGAVQGSDGEWNAFMTITYRRRK